MLIASKQAIQGAHMGGYYFFFYIFITYTVKNIAINGVVEPFLANYQRK